MFLDCDPELYKELLQNDKEKAKGQENKRGKNGQRLWKGNSQKRKKKVNDHIEKYSSFPAKKASTKSNHKRTLSLHCVCVCVCVCVLVAQSCLTLCDPMDCSPPGPFVNGILQARILEWVTIAFS